MAHGRPSSGAPIRLHMSGATATADPFDCRKSPPARASRRFLMHVLPKGLHRIRHYGLFANGNRAAHIAKARELHAWCPCP